ncbi:MAG: (Fe-S)-binding protein, partial [Rhodospirillales bacterium]|nr:(Fe-S)-binding protein [Rhodospirillales bacterium]
AERWATKCSLSGACIRACEDGVNPRFMLSLVRAQIGKRAGDEASRRSSVKAFQDMSQGVKVLSRLQLPPDLLLQLGQLPDADDGQETPDVVFYTGCNVLRTPHIALLALDIMDALGVSYRVMGGPSHCCGVIQLRTGDTANSGRMGESTLSKFSATKTGKVLSWCPSCMIQMDEFAMPSADPSNTGFDLTMFVSFLESRIDDLKALMTRPVNKRVGLHEHSSVEEVNKTAIKLLEAVPGVEYVNLEQPIIGYSCTGLKAMPDYKKELHAGQLQAAADLGVTTLAGVYHVCHRELCSHENDWPFEVVNFLEIIGESMGIHRPDIFKRYRMSQDADVVIAETQDLADANGLAPDEVRDVIENQWILGR